jgi:hypothetical protein
VAIAEQALAQDDAFAGLREFLEASCRLQCDNRGLHQLVFAGEAGPRCAAGARERISPLVMQLVGRAQEQGTVRSDIAPYDVGMVRNMVGRFIETGGDAAIELWPRLLAIVIDGLRADREGTPLPGSTPSAELFEQFLTHRG